MFTMIRLDRPKVKPVRNTPRPAGRFGAGLTPFVPYAVTAPGFVEPSEADRQWAAENLNADGDGLTDAEVDVLAAEAMALASMEALTPPPAGLCSSCGDWADDLAWGLCPDCFIDAATDASIRCQTGLPRVY